MFEGLHLYEVMGNPYAGEKVISDAFATPPEGAPEEVFAEAWAHLVSDGRARSGAGLERSYNLVSRRGLSALTSYLGGVDIGDAWIYCAPDGSRWRIINPFRWRWSPSQDGDPVLVAHPFGDLALDALELPTQELTLTYPITGAEAEDYSSLETQLFAVSPSGDRATLRVGLESSRPEAWLLLTLSVSGGQIGATLTRYRDRPSTRGEVVQTLFGDSEVKYWTFSEEHEYSFTGDEETGTHEWVASVEIQPGGPASTTRRYSEGASGSEEVLDQAIVGIAFDVAGNVVEYNMTVRAEQGSQSNAPTGWVSAGGYTWQAFEPDPQPPPEVYDIPLVVTQTATAYQFLRLVLSGPAGGSLTLEARQDYSWSRTSTIPFYLGMSNTGASDPADWRPDLDRTDSTSEETAEFSDSATLTVDGVVRDEQTRSGSVDAATGLTGGGDGANPAGPQFIDLQRINDQGLQFEIQFLASAGMFEFGVRSTAVPITHALWAMHVSFYIGDDINLSNLDLRRFKGYLSHLGTPPTETRDGQTADAGPRGAVNPGTGEVAIEPEGGDWTSVGWV